MCMLIRLESGMEVGTKALEKNRTHAQSVRSVCLLLSDFILEPERLSLSPGQHLAFLSLSSPSSVLSSIFFFFGMTHWRNCQWGQKDSRNLRNSVTVQRPGPFSGGMWHDIWRYLMFGSSVHLSHTHPDFTSLCRAGNVYIGNLQSLEPSKDLNKCNISSGLRVGLKWWPF